MGFSFVGDPNAEPEEFDRCPEGTYQISGIKKWITKDENEVPVYEYDQMRGDMVVKLELERADGNTGPAWSGTPLDLAMLVRAFGGNLDKLPKNRNTPDFLNAVDKDINSSDKTVTADVGSTGWVSYIKEATPPEGYYQFRLVDARNVDGEDRPYVFQPNQFSKKNGVEDESRWQLMLIFEIVGSMIGNPTPFDGFRVSHYLMNGFQGVHNGLPDLLLTSNGAKSVNARRIERFTSIFAPQIFENDYAWHDAENPIDEILEYALNNEYKTIGHYALNNPKPPHKPRLRLDFDSLQAVEEAVEVEEEESIYTSDFYDARPHLCDLLEWIWTGEPRAFETVPMNAVEDVALTKKGTAWANKNLLKVLVKTDLDPTANLKLADYTEEQALQLLTVIWANE